MSCLPHGFYVGLSNGNRGKSRRLGVCFGAAARLGSCSLGFGALRLGFGFLKDEKPLKEMALYPYTINPYVYEP